MPRLEAVNHVVVKCDRAAVHHCQPVCVTGDHGVHEQRFDVDRDPPIWQFLALRPGSQTVAGGHDDVREARSRPRPRSAVPCIRQRVGGAVAGAVGSCRIAFDPIAVDGGEANVPKLIVAGAVEEQPGRNDPPAAAAAVTSKRMAAISWMLLSLNRSHLPELLCRSRSLASESQISAVAGRRTVWAESRAAGERRSRRKASDLVKCIRASLCPAPSKNFLSRYGISPRVRYRTLAGNPRF